MNLSQALAGDPAENIVLQSRDRVLIHTNADALHPPTVYIEGEVGRPGRYPLTANRTVADLIQVGGGLKASADTRSVELTTYDFADAKSGLMQLNAQHENLAIAAVMSGDKSADVTLHNGDVVTIRKIPGWDDLGSSITVKGEVAHPGTHGIKPGERLSSIIERAGGFQKDAYAYGSVLDHVEVRELESKQQEQLVVRLKNEGAALQNLPDASDAQKARKYVTLQQYQMVLTQLSASSPVGRVAIRISDSMKEWKSSSADIVVRAGDVLVVPKRPDFVMVSGQVFNPTAVSYRPGKSAKWYLSQSGGPTNLANKKEIFVLRADGSVIGGKNGLLSGDPLGAALGPGDTIIVPEKAISGGVQWATLFSTRRLRHLSSAQSSSRYIIRRRGPAMRQGKASMVVIFCIAATGVALMPGRCWGQSQNPPSSNSPAEKSSASSDANTAAPDSQGDATNDTKDSSAGEMSDPQTSTNTYQNSLGIKFVEHLASDQRAIWTSPARLRLSDADWLLPLGTATGILFATDRDFSRHLSNSPKVLKDSRDFSNYGLASMVAAGGGLYVWGRFTHDEHRRETGLLTGEAVIDAVAVNYALKYSFGRERPLTDNYHGAFFDGGDSFPSVHSTAAWAAAGVIAHEYPGMLPTVLSYGAAAAISASRVSAKQHFASDALVGSAIGFLTAEAVYRMHHDPDLGGSAWPTYRESIGGVAGEKSGSVGSPFVEMDSWIYPAIERLAAMGYIKAAYLGMRPWTRLECADLVEDAGDAIRAEGVASDPVNDLYTALVREFSGDLNALADGGTPSAEVESVYSRVTGISGPPLNDGDHFGQTIVDDYGRPYQQGMNTYDGFSAYATAGRFAAYVRGEYQAAPSAAAYPVAVRQAIAVMDANPFQPPEPISSASQFRLLDTYFAADYSDWNFSFGKQSLWWGPGNGSALIFSDNAEPLYMFRMVPTKAFEVPFLSRVLGPFKTDFFVGKLSGNEFPARPVIHGENISFKPTRDLEIGFSRLVEFGGVGRPLTAGAIWNSYVSVKSSVNYRASRNPGKRTSGFDFSYRVPFVRRGLTIYAEAASADDVTPLAAPSRASWNSGAYMPRFLGLSKLDLRVEGGYTDPVTPRSNDGEYMYWDLYYHDLSTNKRNLIASWIGREGKGVRALSAYSFNARSNIQFGYRQAKVAKDFVPNGETINDGSVAVNWWPRSFVNLSGSVQYEKWLAPLLARGPQTNWTSTFEISFWPKEWRTRNSQGAPSDSASLANANLNAQ